MYIGQATQSVGFHDTPLLTFATFNNSTQSSNIPAQINQSQSTGQSSMVSMMRILLLELISTRTGVCVYYWVELPTHCVNTGFGIGDATTAPISDAA